MKSILLLVVSALTMVGCAGKELNSELEGSKSSAPKIYGVHFTNFSSAVRQVQIVVTDGQKTVAKSVCSYDMIGAPSVGGPVSGKITCNDVRAGVKADFETLKSSSGSMWVGTLFFRKSPKAGAQYSCTHDDQSANFLDCYYKSPIDPPQPGGGVSN